MFQKVIHFIKYHNAVSIGISLVLVLTFSAMASEDFRNAVIGEEIVTEQGIDNSQLLSAALENFDTNLKIENILENEENYYVDYAFNTIAVRDNIWQLVVKSEKFTVNKTALGNRDLGIYLAEEFSELARSEMAYLKEAQKTERERGRTQIVETTDYTGLIGLTLDLKNKILAGYEPVVKPPEIIVQPEPAPAPQLISTPASESPAPVSSEPTPIPTSSSEPQPTPISTSSEPTSTESTLPEATTTETATTTTTTTEATTTQATSTQATTTTQ